MKPLETEYYSLGCSDRQRGAGVLDCPVLLVSTEGQDWLAGWTDANEHFWFYLPDPVTGIRQRVGYYFLPPKPLPGWIDSASKIPLETPSGV